VKDIRLNVRLILLFVCIFIFGKFMLRPYVLANEYPEFANIFVLSLPNLCEAVTGVLMLTNFALIINYHWLKNKIGLTYIYLFVTLFAALYVILQEMKIHNIGGVNIYDPYDVVYSVIGLVLSLIYLLVRKPGYNP
jgi:cell division protein FtsW (lipid II flippase)